MVEEVRMFKTEDGKQFSDYDAALMHEHDIKLVEYLVEPLPDNSKLASGEFYQLDGPTVKHSRRAFCMALRNRFGRDNTFVKAIDAYEGDPHCDIVGRLLCDSGSPFNRVFHMFSSIDDRYRMFNQPYFTRHPDAAENQIPFD